VKCFLGWLDVSGAPKLRSFPHSEAYGRIDVLYRGYIANASALINETKKRGEVLSTGSDGELFAKAYQWWGENLQSYVLGEFAVAVFDRQRRTLLLTHDSMGLVPLFYSQRPDTISFGSHLEDLVGHLGMGELDEEYIADYLATGTVTTARTPYVSYRRLLPGESLQWINGRTTALKTWDITRIQPIRLTGDEEYEEHLRSLLQEGVTAALRTEGSVWGELSGGLDSSSVVCMAAHSGTKPLSALSIIYSSSKSADEREWMNAVVQQYTLPWHTLDADQAKPFSELPEFFCAEPASVLPFAGLFRVYKSLADSNGVRVVLTGYGGDQVFCGDSPKPYYLADNLPCQLIGLLRGVRDWQASDPERRPLAYHLWKNVLHPTASYWRGRSLSSPEVSRPPPWIDRDYHRAKRLDKRSARQAAPKCRSVGQQYHTEAIWKIGFTAGDDITQPFEFRHPLLYRPLVEFMLAIPWEHKLRPGGDRVLQRRSLKGILPEQIRLRKDKAGPAEAESEGLRHNSPWAELLLSNARIVQRGYVDALVWKEVVNQLRFGRMRSMRHFVATAAMEVWLRQLEELRPSPRISTRGCDWDMINS
jgi:asparagine synthase (glutamine-hydrolysing)